MLRMPQTNAAVSAMSGAPSTAWLRWVKSCSTICQRFVSGSLGNSTGIGLIDRTAVQELLAMPPILIGNGPHEPPAHAGRCSCRAPNSTTAPRAAAPIRTVRRSRFILGERRQRPSSHQGPATCRGCLPCRRSRRAGTTPCHPRRRRFAWGSPRCRRAWRRRDSPRRQ